MKDNYLPLQRKVILIQKSKASMEKKNNALLLLLWAVIGKQSPSPTKIQKLMALLKVKDS